jgi:kynurenine formamidase
MPVIKSDRFRFFALLVALVAVLSLTPLLLAQNVKCLDGSSVSSFDECKPTQDDSNGEAMEDDEEAMTESSGDSGDWWPSRWGADDQAGASNWITASKVMEAANLIQTGEIYELGQQYTHGMPLFGNRTYSLTIPGAPTGGPFPGGLVYHDEFIVGELGQVGTQFDGLGHVGYIHNGVETFYNGFTEDEIMGAYGLQNLGIESIKPIFTRGILIDIAGYKGEMLDAGTVVTLEDVKGALEAQGMSEDDIQDGDVVLFHYGWGDLWGVDDDRYNAGAPGIGIEVGKWLSGQNVTLVGADTWPVEVVPSEDANDAFAVHKHLLTENGILIHENLNLGTLADDEVYKFAYIFVRVPFKGGTGSPGSPIAVK